MRMSINSVSSISALLCQEAKAKKVISKKDRKEKKMLSSKDDEHFLLSGVKLAAHRGWGFNLIMWTKILFLSV